MSWPTIPDILAMWRPVSRFQREALLYAWTEDTAGDATAYTGFRLVPGTSKFFVCGQAFKATQDDSEIKPLEILDQHLQPWCDDITDESVFQLHDPSGHLDTASPFILHFTANRFYDLHVPFIRRGICPDGLVPVYHWWRRDTDGHIFVRGNDHRRIEDLQNSGLWWREGDPVFCVQPTT